MRRILCLIAALALLVCAAGAETRFDGDTFLSYRIAYRDALSADWECVSYIGPEGLLLSGFNDRLELTVSVDEAKESCEALLDARIASTERFGRVLSRGAAESCDLAGLEEGRRVSYSYTSLRAGEDDSPYENVLYAGRISENYMLTLTLSSWGKTQGMETMAASIASGIRLEKLYASGEYTAFLTGCSEQDGHVQVTLDYCDVAYEGEIGLAYASNPDTTAYTYVLSPEAEVWMPDLNGSLYTMRSVKPTLENINAGIEGFYALNGNYGIYTIVFGSNGQIIRMQHYNAL